MFLQKTADRSSFYRDDCGWEKYDEQIIKHISYSPKNRESLELVSKIM